MKRRLLALSLVAAAGCADTAADNSGPTKSSLPTCDEVYACSYDGYVAQAIHVDGEWTLAATEGRFNDVVDPSVGAGTYQHEGDFQDALIDCTENPKIRDTAYIDGPFDRYDFEDSCQRTEPGDAIGSVEFALGVDGVEFVESHDIPAPPEVSVEQVEGAGTYNIRHEVSGRWLAYIVEDEPGADGTTFFMSIAGDDSFQETTFDPENEQIDAPFSIYAVGTSGGASLIENGSDEFIHGLAIENWRRVDRGTP